MDSVYVSHLGSVDEFFPKFERHLVGYDHKVIIGTVLLCPHPYWASRTGIWNWADDNYPGAVQILDFYHEKLVLFARHQYKDEEIRLDWIKRQSDKLLDNGLGRCPFRPQILQS